MTELAPTPGIIPASILLADPPWRFSSNSEAKPGRNARRHYPVMRDEEIMRLPMEEWAARDALLFLWTTAPMLARTMRVADAWRSFHYISQLVWVKDRIATGHWVRNRHELCLMYKRGKFPCPRPAPFSDSVIIGQQRQHSRKPDALQNQIDADWPGLVKLELFARTQRPGWQVWGNQTDKFPVAA